MTRTISFTLNGEPVAAEIKPHHNLVELLQREFNLLGRARELRPGHVRLLHRARRTAPPSPAASTWQPSSTAPK